MKFLESCQPHNEMIALIWDFVTVEITVMTKLEKLERNHILGRADRQLERMLCQVLLIRSSKRLLNVWEMKCDFGECDLAIFYFYSMVFTQ